MTRIVKPRRRLLIGSTQNFRIYVEPPLSGRVQACANAVLASAEADRWQIGAALGLSEPWETPLSTLLTARASERHTSECGDVITVAVYCEGAGQPGRERACYTVAAATARRFVLECHPEWAQDAEAAAALAVALAQTLDPENDGRVAICEVNALDVRLLHYRHGALAKSWVEIAQAGPAALREARSLITLDPVEGSRFEQFCARATTPAPAHRADGTRQSARRSTR